MTRFDRHCFVLFAALAFVGCGSSTTRATSSTTSTTVAAPTTVPILSGSITVFAASSLTAAFKAEGDAFMKANPAVKVTFSFDASSALAKQITEGAPADVFASADSSNMDKLTTAGLNGSAPVTFATNLLSIIVAPKNPKGIKTEADLAQPDLKVVLCDPTVPCGKYAQQSLDKANVSLTPASLEQNVKGVITKVTAGEADAGIVYVTDVKAAGDKAVGVDISADVNVKAVYPIASVKTSTHGDISKAFIAFLTGPAGQSILATYGFGKP
jgi:molybdate transport system substrate-binding protein